MNREILFRGKTTPTEDCESEWIVGDLLSNAYTIPNIRPLCSICCYQVIPETVGQYTGLTDKKGVKIFEGDIVKYKEMLFEIKYSIEQVRFLAILPNGVFNPVAIKKCEVIGNVHDNLEMLEGEENE